MIPFTKLMVQLLRSCCQSRYGLVLENLALRQQILVLQRRVKRPRFSSLHRLFWCWLMQWWTGWKAALVIIQPETVIGWQRQGFRWFWRRKSRWKRSGRHPISAEVRQLIRTMSRTNPLWGAPRIHGELLKLGIKVAQRTVAKYMISRSGGPSSQNWKSFLRNHVGQMVSVDFLTVPTISFRVLYVFVVLCHDRRRVLHFNITDSPSSGWVAQQLREAFPFVSPPKYLLRDRDGIYGQEFRRRVAALGLEEVLIAPRSPWQSPYVERLIGSMRRECLDHVIVFNQRHLRQLLDSYLSYYHRSRTHLALDKDAPESRTIQGPEQGKIVALPEVGGLHHRYERKAA